ncbi:unnamed protein product [Cylindrotheca closterium]|uniref:Uncharacterized protein n=1 Tax=Cylindrotheca closterium TaxID=2856 RepID=A0AAD2G3Q2_9STRA|nr:unnamed protein product [Cylindrotheca closterium]
MSSHHRRLLWRKKDQRNNVEDDEMPLIQGNNSGLESKFAEFEQILNSNDQWSIMAGASRDNGEYPNDSDVDDRDESHLLDLQRELEAAELGTAASCCHREEHQDDDEEEREDSLLGNPAKITDYQSLASAGTVDSFDVEMAIEKIKMQEKAMEQAKNGSQGDLVATREERIRFEQFVAQMEHDFDGAILAMMEAHSESNSAERAGGRIVKEEVERSQEPDRGEGVEMIQLPQFSPLDTVKEEEPAGESRIESYDDNTSNEDDDDTDFTPFSVPDFPSDESRDYNTTSSLSGSVDQQRILHHYNSSDVADLVSPLTDYGSRPPLSPVTADYDYSNPHQEKEGEPPSEPCIDLDQLDAATVQVEEYRESADALEKQRTKEGTAEHLVQHRVAVQHGAEDGYCDADDDEYRGEAYDDDDDDGNQLWGYFRKSKYPVTGASFLCLCHVIIQILVFRALLGLLMDYHQSTSTNLLMDPSSGDRLPLCQTDSGCIRAIPVALNENGKHEVLAATKSMNHMNEIIHNEACEGSWFQSPTLWYSIVGDGSKHTAIAAPTSEDFDVSIMVFEGQCDRPEFYYGPAQSYGKAAGEHPSLLWDTVAGKEYFIAVFGVRPDSTGSFQMTMWNTQHAKDALSDHIEEKGADSFQHLAVGGAVSISMAFLAAAAFS